MLDLLWAMEDHPRIVVGGCYVFNFGLIRLTVSGILQFLRFSRLKLPIHAHFGSGWGIFPRNDVTYRPTPKRQILARKHIVSQCENRSNGTICARDREKKDRSSHKELIFHLVGKKPPPTDLHPNSHGGCRPRQNHVRKVWD